MTAGDTARDQDPKLRFEPLAAPFGVEVHGLELADLAADGDAIRPALRSALEHHDLVVARALSCTPRDLLRLAELFGDPDTVAGSAIVDISNLAADDTIHAPADAGHGATPWSADGSFRASPPTVGLRHAVSTPTRGGQTQFAAMAKALRLLPSDERDELATLSLVHRDPATEATVEHDWTQRAPDGTAYLYMGAHAVRIAGRDEAEARRWFDEIEAQLSVHDIVYEHRWQPGDLVIYDCRTLLHRTLGYDIANERRRLLQVTVSPHTPG